MIDLTPFATAIGGVTAILMVWLAVQRVWARVFDVGDAHVLQVRDDCTGCTHGGTCSTHCPVP